MPSIESVAGGGAGSSAGGGASGAAVETVGFALFAAAVSRNFCSATVRVPPAASFAQTFSKLVSRSFRAMSAGMFIAARAFFRGAATGALSSSLRGTGGDPDH